MRKPWTNPALLLLSFLLGACAGSPKEVGEPSGTYGDDLAFLREYVPGIVELRDEAGGARLALSAKYQGRVMTSTANGNSGDSYGWINYDLLRSRKILPQFNPVGGEERLWVGPEGGQYSFYFAAGDSFEISKWQVPYLIDTVTYNQTISGNTTALFTTEATLINYSGTPFDIRISRRVNLVSGDGLAKKLGHSLDHVPYVAYETINTITNIGDRQWRKEDGLMSIWLLSMLKPTDQTIAIIPFHPVPGIDTLITDNYFGPVPRDRLVRRDSVLILKCDGKYRSKIGISPRAAKSYAASYDYEKNILSMIYFPVEPDGLYVNSKWEIQDQPYAGDVVNSYNDGPLADGGQLGPFYELESSSPAAELGPGQHLEHRQLTVHVQGNFDQMNSLAKSILGVDLSEIRLP